MTPEEVTYSHEGLILTMASRYATPLIPEEDLAQEARVKLWRVACAKPGDDLRGVASFVVKRRILEVVTSGNHLADRTSGGAGRTFEPAGIVWTDGLTPELQRVIELTMGSEPSAEDVTIGKLSAQDVRNALVELPTDELTAIGWGKLDGDSETVISQRIGQSRSQVHALWSRKVLPTLRETLLTHG